MSLTDLPPTMTLPARDFATAWKNVSMVSGSNTEQVILYKSVLLEVFSEEEARLVATDGHALLRSWVSPDGNDKDEPDLDELPPHRIVVSDPHKRMASMASWMLSATKKEDPDYERLQVTLEVRGIAPDTEPPLTAELAKTTLVVEVEGVEKVWLPIIDGEYPNWRTLWPHDGRPLDTIALAPTYLGLFSKVQGTHENTSCRFYFTGPGRMTRIDYSTWPRLQGLLMPVVSETERVATLIARYTEELTAAIADGNQLEAAHLLFKIGDLDAEAGEEVRALIPDIEPVDPEEPEPVGLFAVPADPVIDVELPDEPEFDVDATEEQLEAMGLTGDTDPDVEAWRAAEAERAADPANSVDASGSFEAQAAGAQVVDLMAALDESVTAAKTAREHAATPEPVLSEQQAAAVVAILEPEAPTAERRQVFHDLMANNKPLAKQYVTWCWENKVPTGLRQMTAAHVEQAIAWYEDHTPEAF